jgi:hypothetical protein
MDSKEVQKLVLDALRRNLLILRQAGVTTETLVGADWYLTVSLPALDGLFRSVAGNVAMSLQGELKP